MHDALHGALEGIDVVAMVGNIPGPIAAARLHALGARVVKIEAPQGDPLEDAAPEWYRELHDGLEVVRLNLRDENDARALRDRLARADLFLTATRSGALRRAGLTWPELQEAFPRLCHVAIAGEAPPNDDRAGHDLTYQARAGLLSPPAMPRSVFADIAASERAVSASLAALLQSRRTGRGVRVDVAIVEAAASFAESLRHGLTGRDGALGGALASYNLYRSADGWVAVAALEEHFARRLADVAGAEPLDAATLERTILQRTSAQWEEAAAAYDLPLAAIPPEKG